MPPHQMMPGGGGGGHIFFFVFPYMCTDVRPPVRMCVHTCMYVRT